MQHAEAALLWRLLWSHAIATLYSMSQSSVMFNGKWLGPGWCLALHLCQSFGCFNFSPCSVAHLLLMPYHIQMFCFVCMVSLDLGFPSLHQSSWDCSFRMGGPFPRDEIRNLAWTRWCWRYHGISWRKLPWNISHSWNYQSLGLWGLRLHQIFSLTHQDTTLWGPVLAWLAQEWSECTKQINQLLLTTRHILCCWISLACQAFSHESGEFGSLQIGVGW